MSGSSSSEDTTGEPNVPAEDLVEDSGSEDDGRDAGKESPEAASSGSLMSDTDSSLSAPISLSDFDRELSVGGNEKVIVVDAESDIVDAGGAGTSRVAYCVFGSQAHQQALEARLDNVEETRRRMLEQQADISKRLAALRDERNALKRQETALSLLNAQPQPAGEAKTAPAHAHTSDDERHKFHAEVVKQFGALEHVSFIEGEEEADAKLFKRPRVRQYFSAGRLVREYVPRRATTVELFFDLALLAAFVETGRILSAIFEEDLTPHEIGVAVQLFAVTFTPIWRLWFEIHLWLNRHDNGDLTIKILTYVIMCIIVVGLGGAAFNILHGTAPIYAAAIVISKGLTASINLMYTWLIPSFRQSLIVASLAPLVTIIPWIPLFFDNVNILGALWAANILELLIPAIIVQMTPVILRVTSPAPSGEKAEKTEKAEKAEKKPLYIIAVNIEHFSERLGLFTILAFGEQITAVVLVTQPIGLTLAHLTSALGLLAAFCYQWIYFALSGTYNSVHPIRASRVRGLLYSYLHVLFHMSILAGAHALEAFILYYEEQETEHEPASEEAEPLGMAARWLLCGSLAIQAILMGVLATLFDDKDPAGYTRLSRRWRVASRFAAGLIIALLPLSGPHLEPASLVAIVASVAVAHLLFELFSLLRRPQLHDTKEHELTDVEGASNVHIGRSLREASHARSHHHHHRHHAAHHQLKKAHKHQVSLGHLG